MLMTQAIDSDCKMKSSQGRKDLNLYFNAPKTTDTATEHVRTPRGTQFGNTLIYFIVECKIHWRITTKSVCSSMVQNTRNLSNFQKAIFHLLTHSFPHEQREPK